MLFGLSLIDLRQGIPDTRIQDVNCIADKLTGSMLRTLYLEVNCYICHYM